MQKRRPIASAAIAAGLLLGGVAGAGCGRPGPVLPDPAARTAAIVVSYDGADTTVGSMHVDIEDDQFVVRVRIDKDGYRMRDLWLTFYDHYTRREERASAHETRYVAFPVACDERDCATACGDLIAVQADIVMGWGGIAHVSSVVTEVSFRVRCAPGARARGRRHGK